MSHDTNAHRNASVNYNVLTGFGNSPKQLNTGIYIPAATSPYALSNQSGSNNLGLNTNTFDMSTWGAPKTQPLESTFTGWDKGIATVGAIKGIADSLLAYGTLKETKEDNDKKWAAYAEQFNEQKRLNKERFDDRASARAAANA